MAKVKVMVLTDAWTSEKAKEVGRAVASEEFHGMVDNFVDSIDNDEDRFITPCAVVYNQAMAIMMHDLPLVDVMLNWLDYGLVKLDDGEMDEDGFVKY